MSGFELIFDGGVTLTINYEDGNNPRDNLVRVDTVGGLYTSTDPVQDIFGTASRGQKPEHLMTTATNSKALADAEFAEGNRLTHIPNLINLFNGYERPDTTGEGLDFLDQDQPLGFDIV